MMGVGAVLGVPFLLAAVTGPRSEIQKIAVDVRGPIALVQVTRTLSSGSQRPGGAESGAESILDIALPQHAALVAAEITEGSRWRMIEPTSAAQAREQYVARLKARRLEPALAPFDDGAAYRVRVARGGTARAGEARASEARASDEKVRYRFSVVPDYLEGRSRIRFPAAPESMPAPADISVTAVGAADVEIAGVRTAFAAGVTRGSATGHASTRAAWEISWATRPAGAPGDTVGLEGSVASARLSPTETAVAVLAQARAGRTLGPPPNVLLLIDRSRSVGLPGLSAERDLARRLLETLPPATRFDVLFFDRAVKRLFPLSRPATREAMTAIEAEMVPDRLQNGTDLVAALREAGALLRREASAFAPRTLLAIITDGALPEGQDGPALDRALGPVAGVDVTVASWTVRPPDDDPAPAAAGRALRALAGARGGVFREIVANEIDEAVPPTLATLEHGGDIAAVRLMAGGGARDLAERLAPGEGRAGILSLPALPARTVEIAGLTRGARIHASLRPQPVDGSWLRPHLGGGSPTRLLSTDAVVALVEPVVRPGPSHDAPGTVRGSIDRSVVRNTLSLAFTPRARACYLSRSGATAALRDLTGRVRLSIDLARGEVSSVVVQSSTLNHPEIEACLREGAFAIEVPRALRNDAAVTAVMNLVFRPRTPEKHSSADEAALGAQIDLIIEDLHRTENLPAAEAPMLDTAKDSTTGTPTDRSLIPTR
jgi:von Willebrand factor type A domain